MYYIETTLKTKHIQLLFTNYFKAHFTLESTFGLVVWLSGNTLVTINEVTLRQARLILGWVTVCGQVHYLYM